MSAPAARELAPFLEEIAGGPGFVAADAVNDLDAEFREAPQVRVCADTAAIVRELVAAGQPGDAVVVMSNAADEIAVPSQALWGDVVKLLYPDTLPTWP